MLMKGSQFNWKMDTRSTINMDTRNTNFSNFFRSSTSKSMVLFDGLQIETTITDAAEKVDQWIRQVTSTFMIDNQMIVGLDTEWMCVYINQKRKFKVAILQLCVENKCLIFQLHHMDYIPLSLRNFMTNSNVKFTGVEVKNDMKMLKHDYGLEFGNNNGVDVALLAMKKWPDQYLRSAKPGLKLLAKDLVGLNMEKDKKVTNSNWHLKELTEVQVEYACIDAYASYKIGKILLSIMENEQI